MKIKDKSYNFFVRKASEMSEKNYSGTKVNCVLVLNINIWRVFATYTEQQPQKHSLDGWRAHGIY